jgi:hypothetical protein
MSTVKERIDDILSRPMTRQQFLKQVGLLLLAVVGITNIINAFDSKHTGKQSVGSQGSPAYGASVYAGGKKPV